jgi:hypothetical protein
MYIYTYIYIIYIHTYTVVLCGRCIPPKKDKKLKKGVKKPDGVRIRSQEIDKSRGYDCRVIPMPPVVYVYTHICINVYVYIYIYIYL